jgi:hypothetical protein
MRAKAFLQILPASTCRRSLIGTPVGQAGQNACFKKFDGLWYLARRELKSGNSVENSMALTSEEIAEIRKLAETRQQTMLDASKNIVSLWKSQLDMALATNDEDLVREVLQSGNSMTPSYVDTNCSCGGGRGK